MNLDAPTIMSGLTLGFIAIQSGVALVRGLRDGNADVRQQCQDRFNVMAQPMADKLRDEFRQSDEQFRVEFKASAAAIYGKIDILNQNVITLAAGKALK